MTKRTYTPEQLAIFDEMIDPTKPITIIKATAGSTKTSSLVEGTKRALAKNPKLRIRFLIFNSVPALEAKKEFGAMAIVSTLHAYAYANVVNQYKLNKNIAQFLSWQDIPKHIKRPFGTDSLALDYAARYCSSEFLAFKDFRAELQALDEPFSYGAYALASKLLDEMANGKMRITHSFYLKFFHILVMNGSIQLQTMDKLYYDEFQDSSKITLDILRKIPATQKIFVGDQDQKLYGFLNLKDGFAEYPKANVLTLTKSFRVASSYASSIDHFLKTNLAATSTFTGMEYPPNPELVTKAYLTRTNSSLVSKMIELNQTGTPYHLATKTKVKAMFLWPLALVYAKPKHKQLNPELKHFQHNIDEWGKTKRIHNLSLYKYLNAYTDVPPQLAQAMKLLLKFDKEDIIKAASEAFKHQKSTCNLTLMTVFVSKGITRDVIELDNDINKSVAEVLAIPIKQRTEEEVTELRIAFVAVTRHRHSLLNCKFLTPNGEPIENTKPIYGIT